MSKLSGGWFSEKVCIFGNHSLTHSFQLNLKQNKTLMSASLPVSISGTKYSSQKPGSVVFFPFLSCFIF